MSGTVTLDRAALSRYVQGKAESILATSAEEMLAHAKRNAPVRKVTFEGVRYKTRALTAREKRGQTLRGMNARYHTKALRAIMAKRTGSGSLKGLKGVIIRDRHWKLANAGSFMATPQNSWQLTARGRREVARGTPYVHETEDEHGVITRTTFATQLGGRLRREIHVTDVEPIKGGWRVQLISPTPYAIYVEFPTTHNRAQPYMLPALRYEKRRFVRRVARAFGTMY